MTEWHKQKNKNMLKKKKEYERLWGPIEKKSKHPKIPNGAIHVNGFFDPNKEMIFTYKGKLQFIECLQVKIITKRNGQQPQE